MSVSDLMVIHWTCCWNILLETANENLVVALGEKNNLGITAVSRVSPPWDRQCWNTKFYSDSWNKFGDLEKKKMRKCVTSLYRHQVLISFCHAQIDLSAINTHSIRLREWGRKTYICCFQICSWDKTLLYHPVSKPILRSLRGVCVHSWAQWQMTGNNTTLC